MAFLPAAYPLNPTIVHRAFDAIAESGDFMFPFDLKILARAFVIVPKGKVWQVLTTCGGVSRFQDECSLSLRVDMSSHPLYAGMDWPDHVPVYYDNQLLINHVHTGRSVFTIRKTHLTSIAVVLMKIALRFSQSVCVNIDPCLKRIDICLRDKWDPFLHLSETEFYANRIGINEAMIARVMYQFDWTRWCAGLRVDPGLLEQSWVLTRGMLFWYHNEVCPRSQVYKWYRCGNCLDSGCECCENPQNLLPPPVLTIVRADDIDIICATELNNEFHLDILAKSNAPSSGTKRGGKGLVNGPSRKL
jgi:hypothetical protein